MDVQFFQIFADSLDAKADYIKHKLAHSPASLPRAEHWAAATDSLNETPQVEQTANWPALSADQEAEVQRRIKCGAKMANRFLPLADGEVIEEDAFSYLTAAWGHAQQGTPVLRRTTNQAVIYCFYDDFEVVPGEAEPLRPIAGADDAPAVPDAAESAQGEAVGFAVEEIALDIAKALLEKLASFAIEQVMGSSVPDYFGEVYAEMRKIVSQELDAHMIKEITDEFVAAQDWNNRHYLPLKEAVPPTPPDQLVSEMNTEQVKFYSYLAKLEDATVAEVCLGEFMIGASIHLAFIQELFNVNGASHWKVELSKNAVARADHAEKTWKAISDIRAGKIKVQADADCTPVNGATKCNYYYTSYDYFAGTWGGKFFYQASDSSSENKAKARAESDAAARRTAAIADLRNKLGKPEETIAKWRALQ